MTQWDTFSTKTFYPLIDDINDFDDFNIKLQSIKDKKLNNSRNFRRRIQLSN